MNLESVKLTVLEMSKGSYASLFKMSEYREFHRVVLAYVNQMFQQISGINLITYYVRCLWHRFPFPFLLILTDAGTASIPRYWSWS